MARIIDDKYSTPAAGLAMLTAEFPALRYNHAIRALYGCTVLLNVVPGSNNVIKLAPVPGRIMCRNCGFSSKILWTAFDLL